jgi:hypothetical protein
MHFTHPILNPLERGWNVRILTNTYRWNQTNLSNEYQSYITSMAKLKSKPLIRPNSMCFIEPSRCDGKITPFSALILQTKVIRSKWCDNRVNSTHFTHPILNRLERGSNVRILPNTILNRLERSSNVRKLLNTNRWNQTRFINRISVELHFYGYTKVKASNST